MAAAVPTLTIAITPMPWARLALRLARWFVGNGLTTVDEAARWVVRVGYRVRVRA